MVLIAAARADRTGPVDFLGFKHRGRVLTRMAADEAVFTTLKRGEMPCVREDASDTGAYWNSDGLEEYA
jgi:hypothetical protein